MVVVVVVGVVEAEESQTAKQASRQAGAPLGRGGSNAIYGQLNSFFV